MYLDQGGEGVELGEVMIPEITLDMPMKPYKEYILCILIMSIVVIYACIFSMDCTSDEILPPLHRWAYRETT